MLKKLLLSLIIAVPVVAQADWMEWNKDDEKAVGAYFFLKHQVKEYTNDYAKAELAMSAKEGKCNNKKCKRY